MIHDSEAWELRIFVYADMGVGTAVVLGRHNYRVTRSRSIVVTIISEAAAAAAAVRRHYYCSLAINQQLRSNAWFNVCYITSRQLLILRPVLARYRHDRCDPVMRYAGRFHRDSIILCCCPVTFARAHINGESKLYLDSIRARNEIAIDDWTQSR